MCTITLPEVIFRIAVKGDMARCLESGAGVVLVVAALAAQHGTRSAHGANF